MLLLFQCYFFKVRAKTNRILKNIFNDNTSNRNMYQKQHTKDKTYVPVQQSLEGIASFVYLS